jgi:hypothetical protein
MRVIALTILIVGAASFADEPYFPVSKKAGDPGISEFEAQWYGKSLARMNEPRLTEASKDAKAFVFRLTILPTWGNPIAVRAQRLDGEFTLFARRLDGHGGFDPGKLAEQKEAKLSPNDSKTLDSLRSDLKFFQMPIDDHTRATDGEEWVLEGVNDGKYHVVQRWCASTCDPQKRGLDPFLALCRFLVDKSTLSERPKNRGHELIPPK